MTITLTDKDAIKLRKILEYSIARFKIAIPQFQPDDSIVDWMQDNIQTSQRIIEQLPVSAH